MPPPDVHLLRLQPAPMLRDSESVLVLTRREAQPARPLFRAPSLPTPRQLASELPFTVNFRRRTESRG